MSISEDTGVFRSTYMSIKDFNYVSRSSTVSNLGTSHSLANEPVSAKEGSRAPIQGILVHGALFNGPL